MNYSLSTICEITSSRLVGPDRLVRSILTDSRTTTATADTLFIALRGANHDGHDYIAPLYNRGIRAFWVEEIQNPEAFPEAGFVVTQDALKALQNLATYHRSQFRGTVVAITGSNGKTVTKEWIAQLCPRDISLFRSPRSYNSQLGVPLSILMLRGDEQLAVIEAGISAPGEMERLEAIIRPDIGILTHIGDAHGENFRDVTHKLQEKLQLFKNCKTLIYNPEDPLVRTVVAATFPRERCFTVGKSEAKFQRNSNSTTKNSLKSSSAQKCSNTLDKLDLEIHSVIQPGNDPTIPTRSLENRDEGIRYTYPLVFSDKASLENSLEAVALYFALHYPAGQLQKILTNLKELQPVAMRLELKEGVNGCKIVNDSYNSDIHSLELALDYLASIAANNDRILILSDIHQTGLAPLNLYTEVGRLMHTHHIRKLIGIGKELFNYRELFPCETEFFLTTNAFLNSLKRANFRKQAILIKGGRVFQFERISRALEHQIHTTVLEVNLDAMIHNLNHFRAKLPPHTKIMAMVKAHAYGTGAYEVAAILQNQRVNYLAVAFADEGVTLREAGIQLPIVVLNADAWSFPTMIAEHLEPEIYNFTSLEMFVHELLHTHEIDYPIHLKIDTGMHRLGFVESEIGELLERLKAQDTITIASVFSHLAASDEPDQDPFTHSQIACFQRICDRIQQALPKSNFLRHIANSAAIERFPQATENMVRLGIGLYGISATEDPEVTCVTTLKTRIVQIKHLTPGETVGYGRHGVIRKPTTIATVPIGYADGLNRHLGNGRWSFRLHEQNAPIIGNICMDTCMLDISGIQALEGDEVIVFGPENTITQMASQLQTIPYEILTGLSARIKRIYTKE